MKNSFRVLVLVLLATWVGFSLFDNKQYNDLVVASAERKLTATPVQTTVARRQPLTTTIKAAGKVEGTNEVFIVSTAAGEVERIWVQPGSQVAKGDLLATIDSYYLQQQFDLAKAAYDQDLKDYERLKSMAELNAVTGQQLEQYALKVSSSETRMNLVRRQLGETNVRASVAGTINQIFTSEGSMLGPGRPVCEIVGGPFNLVKAGVQERYRPYLRAGLTVTLKDFSTVYPTTATIGAIGVKPNQLGKVPIEIVFDPIDQLYAGRLVDIEVRVSTDSAVFLPQEAVLTEDGNNYLFLHADGKAVKQTVTIGEQIDGRVRVTTGINDGQSIVLEGNTLIQSGDSLRILEE